MRLMITFSSTMHLRTLSSEGISYITSSSTSSIVGAQAAGAGLALLGLAGGRLQRLVGEDQLDVVQREELLVLLDDGVLRLGQDPHQLVAA